MSTYRVVTLGVGQGQDRKETLRRLAATFRLPENQLGHLVASSRAVVTRGADIASAARIQTAVEAAGCECVVEPELENPSLAQPYAKAQNDAVAMPKSSGNAVGTYRPTAVASPTAAGISPIVKWGGGFILLCVAFILWSNIFSPADPATALPQLEHPASGKHFGDGESWRSLFGILCIVSAGLGLWSGLRGGTKVRPRNGTGGLAGEVVNTVILGAAGYLGFWILVAKVALGFGVVAVVSALALGHQVWGGSVAGVLWGAYVLWVAYVVLATLGRGVRNLFQSRR